MVGGSLGLAVLTVLAAADRTDELLGRGQELVAATAAGYRLAFGVGTAAGALALAAALLRTRREGSGAARGA